MDFSWIDVIVGAVGYATASKIGQAAGARRERARTPKEPEPICGCEHHFAKHDENGVCQFRWQEKILVERGKPRTVQTGYDGATHKVVYDFEKYETVTYACSCKRYTGPEPLPRFVS
jgi:hypothetical protein